MSPKVSEQYKKKKKKEIIQTAKSVFIEKGFTHTSMQDVMNQANISRGTLYSYFNNIEDVFMEVLKDEDDKDIYSLINSTERSQWLKLKRWIEGQQAYIERIDETLVHAKAEFFLSCNNEKNNAYISRRYHRVVAVVEELLNKGMLNDEFHSQQSTEWIARYLISFINGLMLDTFQLGYEQTKVRGQLSIMLLSLENILKPNTQNEE